MLCSQTLKQCFPILISFYLLFYFLSSISLSLQILSGCKRKLTGSHINKIHLGL